MVMPGYKRFDYWATCRKCRDQFSLVVWGRKDPKHDGRYVGFVEPSGDVQERTIIPVHRCGGNLDLYGDEVRLRLTEWPYAQ